MHQVQELSAKEKEFKRSQTSIKARKASLMAGGRDCSTSTPNSNLSNQKQTVLNSIAQNFTPSITSKTAQPWLMPECMTPPHTPLYKTTYGRTIGGTVPTCAQQIQHQTQFETSQFGDFAELEVSGTKSYADSQTFATTCHKLKWPTLGLINMEQPDDFESYSGVSTFSIYCTNFREIYNQSCVTKPERHNFGSPSDQELNEYQRVEERRGEVVNASPEIGLFSESSFVLAGKKLNSWISAQQVNSLILSLNFRRSRALRRSRFR